MNEKYDKLMEQIADYVCNYKVESEAAIKRAYLTLYYCSKWSQGAGNNISI
jgi:hypothetical protein